MFKTCVCRCVSVTFGKANATLSKKKSSLAEGVWLRFEKLTKTQHFKTSFWQTLLFFLLNFFLNAKYVEPTEGIVTLFGDVVLLLHDQLQLGLPLNVRMLAVLDHVVN